MCGIAGLLDYRKTSTPEILERMTRAVAHRGPDGEGYYWCDKYEALVGLGHRRLSIIDLSNQAAQPMHYKNLHITFNGEIYNYQDIKDELIKAGHLFSTGSDTEVILHAYEQWGITMLHRFVGMFAFVIYDSGQQQIIAVRDRAGVKPFYYYHHNKLFLFGSELKTFHEHPAFEKKLNVGAVASFLQYGNVPAPNSIFDHTAKLLPGHYLLLDIRKKQIKTHQYWSVYDCYNQPRIQIDYPEAITETERIFQKAFDYRMVADVPVGVFLSGGYDSSCVTALLQKNRTEKIKTFTIGTTDTKSDEAPFAKQIAAHLGTDHTEYYCTEQEAREIIPALPLYYDEPFADSSAIPTMLVSRLARKKVIVALSADGGDEIFSGYTKYQYLLKMQQRLSGLPKTARGLGHGLMKSVPVGMIPALRDNQAWLNKYERLTTLLKEPSIENVFASASRLFTSTELDKLLAVDYSLVKSCHQRSELKDEFYDPLSYMMAVDYETYLADDIMQKVDRASMSIGLESREPLLDQHIIEWTGRLPLNMKVNNGQTKYILKEIVHKYIPRAIMERPKKGFTIPITAWMKTDFREMVYSYLSEDYVTKQGLFDKEVVRLLLDGYYKKNTVPTEKIWYMLMFQMWYDKWINRPGQ